jgi:thiol-disulfide isomerase/thioredoxin
MVTGENQPLLVQPSIAPSSNDLRMIKHYSPSCPHCKTAAPIYQTLYEYYYVSIHSCCSDHMRSETDSR